MLPRLGRELLASGIGIGVVEESGGEVLVEEVESPDESSESSSFIWSWIISDSEELLLESGND